MTFKYGDKVKRKLTEWTGLCAPTLAPYSELTVSAYFADQSYPTLCFEESGSYQWDAAYFELVEEEKVQKRFVIGDRVISIIDTPNIPEGFIGHIFSADKGPNWDYMVQSVKDQAVEYFNEDELELLSAAKEEAQPVVTQTAGPIKSDGGSSSYYDLPVPEWLLSELFDREIATEGKPYIKTEEIIAAFFGNDFDLGNVVKCLVRVKGLQDKTGGKAGNSVDYECNKMKYSVEKIRGKR